MNRGNSFQLTIFMTVLTLLIWPTFSQGQNTTDCPYQASIPMTSYNEDIQTLFKNGACVGFTNQQMHEPGPFFYLSRLPRFVPNAYRSKLFNALNNHSIFEMLKNAGAKTPYLLAFSPTEASTKIAFVSSKNDKLTKAFKQAFSIDDKEQMLPVLVLNGLVMNTESKNQWPPAVVAHELHHVADSYADKWSRVFQDMDIEMLNSTGEFGEDQLNLIQSLMDLVIEYRPYQIQ